jgi:hypothetical protein
VFIKSVPILLTIVMISGCVKDQPRESKPQDEKKPIVANPAPSFSGKQAFAYLTAQTAFGPRNPGSRGHEECLNYLVSELNKFTPSVETQPFTLQGYGETLKLTNIIARFNPAAASRVILLAHWDTRPRAEHDPDKSKRSLPILGANDGASGVAVLLQMASLFKRQSPSIGVDLLFVDGEDYGMESDHSMYLLGTRYFASHLPAGYAPKFGVLLDMVGDTYLDLPKEQHSMKYAPDIVNMVWNTAANLGMRQFVQDEGEQIIDDHLPLNEAGIKTIDIIDFDYPDPSNRYWHTHADTPDHCSPESLEAVGSVLTSVVYAQLP